MPADHTPTGETVLRTGGSPLPPSPISATQVTQQIVDVVNAWRREGCETSILKRPDPTLAGYAAVAKIGRIVAGALEALSADNARLTAELTELRAQYLADFGQRHQPEAYATTDHGRPASPLDDPEYPALVRLARESMRDGD